MDITIIGAGAWGTALAISLAANHRVTLWGRDAAQIAEMQTSRRNQRYLPDISLPDYLELSADLTDALATAELAIIAVPTSALRSTLQQFASRFPLSNSLGETTSHSTRLQTTAAKSLVIPQAGERTNEKGIVKFPGVVWVCKGFEAKTSLLPHQVVAEVLPEGSRCAVL